MLQCFKKETAPCRRNIFSLFEYFLKVWHRQEAISSFSRYLVGQEATSHGESVSERSPPTLS